VGKRPWSKFTSGARSKTQGRTKVLIISSGRGGIGTTGRADSGKRRFGGNPGVRAFSRTKGNLYGERCNIHKIASGGGRSESGMKRKGASRQKHLMVKTVHDVPAREERTIPKFNRACREKGEKVVWEGREKRGGPDWVSQDHLYTGHTST